VAGIADEFPFDDGIVLLNHASFGVPTIRTMAVAEHARRRIERDAAGLLAGPLMDDLRLELACAADFLAAPPDRLALTMNATEGAAAVASSLARRGPVRVAMLDSEYPSVVRAWQVAAADHGGSVQLVRLEAPVCSDDEVLDALDRQVEGRLDVVVASLVTSPTALRLPVEQIARWASQRGAVTVVDAAHGPGHIDMPVDELGASVVYGTLHKWLPVPRPLGFLYAADGLVDVLRPAMVALDWDDGFAERFAWRGTWDPAPALSFCAALEQWLSWQRDGLLATAERMAAVLSEQLVGCGLQPTGAGSLLPPRLRGFLVPDTTEDELRAALGDAAVRAWTGVSPAGHTLLRVATHVYTTEDHVQRIVDAVTSARREPVNC
jgi:isopenicillin-N epimerase